MRKCILVFLLTLISLCACASPTQAANAGSPPPMLVFRTPEEFDAFMSAPSLSDAAFQDYLSTNSLGISGLNDRSDVNNAAAPLLSVGFPRVENSDIVQDFGFVFYASDQRYSFYYTINDVQYHFQYTKYESKTDRSQMTPTCSFELDGETVMFYHANDRLGGELYRNDQQILIVVSGYTSIDQISFAPFTFCRSINTDPVA